MSLTFPLKPDTLDSVRVEEPADPMSRVRLEGFTLIAKSAVVDVRRELIASAIISQYPGLFPNETDNPGAAEFNFCDSAASFPPFIEAISVKPGPAERLPGGFVKAPTWPLAINKSFELVVDTVADGEPRPLAAAGREIFGSKGVVGSAPLTP